MHSTAAAAPPLGTRAPLGLAEGVASLCFLGGAAHGFFHGFLRVAPPPIEGEAALFRLHLEWHILRLEQVELRVVGLERA